MLKFLCWGSEAINVSHEQENTCKDPFCCLQLMLGGYMHMHALKKGLCLRTPSALFSDEPFSLHPCSLSLNTTAKLSSGTRWAASQGNLPSRK